MEWLKPITEKLNANIFILAISITTLLWWYFSQLDILLVIGGCCAIYLIILFIYNCFLLFRDKRYRHKQESEAIEKMLEEERQENQRIGIWFAALPQFQIDKLLKLLTWRCAPNAINVRVYSPDKEILGFNDDEFMIDMGLGQEPIRLLGEIGNNCSGANKSYYIHPHLMKLLIEYKHSSNNQNS